MKPIVKGPFPNFVKVNPKDAEDMAIHQTERVHQDIENVRHSFITLGFHLWEIRQNNSYEALGFLNFEAYCLANFGLERSTVSRYIDVWYNFCAVDGGSRKMWIDEKYNGYSYSQLTEMLPLDDKQRKEIHPSMTVKEIREKKQSFKKTPVVINQNDGYIPDEKIFLALECLIGSKKFATVKDIHEYLYKHCRTCGGCRENIMYQCSSKDIRIDNYKEISWNNFFSRVTGIYLNSIELRMKFINEFLKQDETVCDVAQEEPEFLHPDVKDFGNLLNIEPRVSNAFVTLGIDFEEQEIIYRDEMKLTAVSEIHKTILDNILKENYEAAYINTLDMLVYLAMYKAR